MPKHPRRMVVLLALTVILLSGCGVSNGTDESSNSTSQMSTQRTGVYNTRGLHSSPSVAWKFMRGEIKSSPAIADGTIYLGSADEHLYALDASNGQFRWKLITGDKVRSSPVVQDGVVYVGSDDGALYAADAKTGTEKWRSKTYGYFILLDEQGTCCEDYLKSNLPPPGMDYLKVISSDTSGWGISASPVITGDHIYFADERAYFYSADLRTGEIEWVTTTQSGSTSTAAAEGDALYFLSKGGSIFSIDAKTNYENWRLFTLDDFYNSSVVIANGIVYAAGRELWAVNAFTGQEMWRFSGKGNTTAPIVLGDRVYITSGEHMYGLDAQTGAKLWEFNTGHNIWTATALANGLLYVSNSDGYLYAIDAGTGQEVWKFKLGCVITTAPAIADGMVYFGCDDGYLYALK